MDAVFHYELPGLHPLAVHFPLVLLLTAALGALIWSYVGTAFWRRLTLFLTALGTAGCFFAYFTGEPMLEQAEGVPIVDELSGLHEDMALFTLVASCVSLVLLSAVSIRAERQGLDRDPILARIGVACLIFVAAALVAWTAHVGATMTWGIPAS